MTQQGSASERVKNLSPSELRLLGLLRQVEAPQVLISMAAAKLGESETSVYSTASWLAKKGFVNVVEDREAAYGLGDEAKRFLEQNGLPEERVHAYVASHPDQNSLEQLNNALGPEIVRVALAWWKRKGLGTIDKRDGSTRLMAHASAPTGADYALLTKIQELIEGSNDGLVAEATVMALDAKALERLRQRPGVLTRDARVSRSLELTPLGKEVEESALAANEVIGDITPDLLRSGDWQTGQFQTYDVGTAPPRTWAAKPHPLAQIIDEVREIFVELGFQEIEEEFVQSAFWNMDALFIPQDHPAREMQDTFYLKHPAKIPVDGELIKRIGRVHKSGSGAASDGWGTPLDPDESQRALLRTHTTVGTIRYLANQPKPPVRVFSVGRVFRHETMDATHLPEFHQVEGIATEPGADFPMLLGTLQEFYRRLGFPKLRWRPAYFPYTEPSMEIEVWTNNKWMELGGCGIFRPEVTRPFGVKTPVLAWGLGLERLAMMRLGLSDIRDLYVSDVEWLRQQPLS